MTEATMRAISEARHAVYEYARANGLRCRTWVVDNTLKVEFYEHGDEQNV